MKMPYVYLHLAEPPDDLAPTPEARQTRRTGVQRSEANAARLDVLGCPGPVSCEQRHRVPGDAQRGTLLLENSNVEWGVNRSEDGYAQVVVYFVGFEVPR